MQSEASNDEGIESIADKPEVLIIGWLNVAVHVATFSGATGINIGKKIKENRFENYRDLLAIGSDQSTCTEQMIGCSW